MKRIDAVYVVGPFWSPVICLPNITKITRILCIIHDAVAAEHVTAFVNKPCKAAVAYHAGELRRPDGDD